MEKQLLWTNNKSTIATFWGRSSSLIFVLSTRFSTLESVSFVRRVRCGTIILSCVQGRLTTSKTLICIQSGSPIGLCAKHQNCRLENGIHHHGNWDTIGYTSKWSNWWLREMWWRDMKQDNILKIQQLEPQPWPSGIWNVSLRQLSSHMMFSIPSISVCLGILWTG